MHFDRISRQTWLGLVAALIVAIAAFGAYSSNAAAADGKVTLAGQQEVPPVKNTLCGTGLNSNPDIGFRLSKIDPCAQAAPGDPLESERKIK